MSVAVQTMEKDKVGLPVEADPADPDGSLSDEGEEEESKNEIRKPGPHDVLLGRGGGTNNHSGNVKFRQLVREHKMRYLACSKVEKPKVAREVVQLWRKLDPPGRFLQRKDESKKGPGSVKDENNIWVEVSEKKAREKASQCLRERTEDVLPYLSHLRQQQDQMTEQGVSQVQRQLQMEQAGTAYNSPNATAQARRNSLVNMPDRPTQANVAINRRGSMPPGSGNFPAAPLNGGIHERRTSMPAASQLHNQQQQLNMNMHLMSHQQQVLRDAYTVIERSGGMQTHQNMVGMQAMSQQQLLAERQALMQQQYANFEGQMMQNNLSPQERMLMQNNLIAQQNHAMGRAGVPGMMDPGVQQQGINMAMMANSNNNMANLNAGMHNMNMIQQQMQMHQLHSPRGQQRVATQQLDNSPHAAMPQLSPHGMNAQGMNALQSPRGMNAQHSHPGMNAMQSPHAVNARSMHVMSRQHSGNMNPNHQQQDSSIKQASHSQDDGRASERTPPHPVRDIHVPLNPDDLEPLPYGQEGQTGDNLLLNEPIPDSHKSSGPPRFISPNILDRSEKRQGDEKAREGRDSPGGSSNKRSNSSRRLGGDADEYDNLNPLPVDHGDNRGRENDDDILGGDTNVGQGEGKGDSTLKEYRKTLESYITNHQISTPAVDIDDDVSDEGGGFEGIDASAWIQQALNDSADLSISNPKGNNPASMGGGRRGLMKDHRENSKKSLMSTGTGDAGSCMSIALSDMEESVPLRDTHSHRDAPTRSSFSNRSISSELTDFSELDCL